jgi:DNA recombination protein RmuC
MLAFAELIIGLLVGGAVVWLVLRRRMAKLTDTRDRLISTEKELAALTAAREAERQTLDAAKHELAALVKAESADALRANQSSFLELAQAQLVGPIKQSLDKVEGGVRVLEQARARAFGALDQQLRTLAEGQDLLRRTTGSLVTALRAPHVRGRWGETQLKRVLEAAGMVEHCDFILQPTTRDAEGALLRPDVIVRLPGNKQVVIDAKVPIEAYLDAFDSEEDDARTKHLLVHARQVRDHVTKLAAKAYWRQFEPSPDFVIMFLPDETFLRAAQEHDSSIGEYAWGSNVIPASPTNLFALLRTIAAIWHQETVATSARQIHILGQELYERLGTMGGHLHQLGRSLESAVGHYNKTIGTVETRVLVTARKLEEHGISGDLTELSPVEVAPRPVTAPELVETEAAPRALDAA